MTRLLLNQINNTKGGVLMKSKSILCLVLAVMLAAVWYAPCLAAEK